MISSYSILYAEDEEDVRSEIKTILLKYFQNVYEASNGKEAYDIYIKLKPNILILDIYMPILNGLELAKKIRKNDKECKIIILSAHKDHNTLIEACELNLSKYMLKPIKISKLIETITITIDELDDVNNNTNLLKISKNIKFDTKNLVLYENGIQIKLTKNEISLLNFLVQNKTSTLSNEEILNYIWEDDIYKDFDAKNKLRVLVYRLNKKLSHDIITSIYGIGYHLNCNIYT